MKLEHTLYKNGNLAKITLGYNINHFKIHIKAITSFIFIRIISLRPHIRSFEFAFVTKMLVPWIHF